MVHRRRPERSPSRLQPCGRQSGSLCAGQARHLKHARRRSRMHGAKPLRMDGWRPARRLDRQRRPDAVYDSGLRSGADPWLAIAAASAALAPAASVAPALDVGVDIGCAGSGEEQGGQHEKSSQCLVLRSHFNDASRGRCPPRPPAGQSGPSVRHCVRPVRRGTGAPAQPFAGGLLGILVRPDRRRPCRAAHRPRAAPTTPVRASSTSLIWFR